MAVFFLQGMAEVWAKQAPCVKTYGLHNPVARVATSPYGDRITAKRIAGLLPVANVGSWRAP